MERRIPPVQRGIRTRFHACSCSEGFGIRLSGPAVENDQDLEPDLPKDPVQDWTCEQVVQWLTSKGFEEYVDIFKTNAMRGQDLLHMSRKDLKELGVPLLGHQMQLHREIRRLERL